MKVNSQVALENIQRSTLPKVLMTAGNHQLTAADRLVHVLYTGNGAVNVILPAPSECVDGGIYFIYVIDLGTGTVVVKDSTGSPLVANSDVTITADTGYVIAEAVPGASWIFHATKTS